MCMLGTSYKLAIHLTRLHARVFFRNKNLRKKRYRAMGEEIIRKRKNYYACIGKTGVIDLMIFHFVPLVISYTTTCII